jgi:tetratricopeptide (TPR) repeat protein
MIVAVAAGANPLNRATGTLSFWLTDRFLLPWLAAAAVFFGGGILLLRAALPARARPGAWLAGAVVPVVLLASGFRGADHSRDYLGFDYALFAEAYTQAFPLYDSAFIEGNAPSLVMTVPFLAEDAGWRRLARRLPEAGEPSILAAPAGERPAALADRLLERGRVYHLTMCSDPLLRERLAWRGIACEVLPASARSPSATRAEIEARFRRMRLRGLWGLDPSRNEAAWTVLDVYGVAASAAADGAVKAGRAEEALAEWDHALKVPGRVSRVVLLGATGNALLSLGRAVEAEGRFREAVAIEPLNPGPWAGLASACAFQGRRAAALRYARWALRWQPDNQGASRIVARLGGFR